MHDYPIIVFLALLTFLYGLISRLSERTPVTAPMVFVAIGIAVSPLGFDLVTFTTNDAVIQIVAELTLVSILFIEASSIDLRALVRERGLPSRLLLIGLPLTMLLGTLLAAPLFPEFNWWLLALMAFILAPTDAALGQAVVTSPLVPEPIRRAINVESGINDGMVLPPILVCIAALAAAAADQRDAFYWLEFTAGQLLIGPLAGAAVGWFGGMAVDYCSRHQLMNQTYQRLSAIALAILAWGLAEQLHGNGYIAAFFGGLLLDTKTHSVRERIQEFGEAEGQQLALFVFLIFGLVMVPAAYDFWNWQSLVYALLSLTLIRMVPVLFALAGTELSFRDRLFIGWFGPRGIASILYLEMVIIKLGLPGYTQMLSVVVLTVLLSVFLHGLTAVPLARTYK
jgi:NhaP-type Na+/H+ or K+/H+ antiporter